MKPERWRLFVAAPVVDEVKAAIAQLLERTDITREFKCSRLEKIHLTIRFFGNVSAGQVPELQARLAEVCRRAAPFSLRAEGLGQFGQRVLWVDLQGDLAPLRQLVAETAAQTAGFGEHRDERDFTPHITIGRRVHQRSRTEPVPAFLQAHRSTAFGEWRVDHLELIRSALGSGAAQYATLARLPLGAPVPR
ncbi:MAG: 2'-5' RNA ligase [Limisphaerales bacterium]|nr:MAG: 2'-5' RNA ligase [Limisphaerales bacterium]KAG0509221.1 MAG: 2'-5' RNA ligase [Limisphaerales bacterium]TXT52240.1 MAG: 2'-5' RNA ligase [Limisphaerales bacterium]